MNITHRDSSPQSLLDGTASVADSRSISVDAKATRLASGVKTFEIPFTHEYPKAGRSVLREEIEIPPSFEASRVVATSTVVSEPNPNSPGFVAVIRRRATHRIAEMIENLRKHVARDDFDVPVCLVLMEVKEALDKLASAKTEGNAREVFRQLRDSMMDGRWIDYKSQTVRQVVWNILTEMGGMEQVDPKFYRESYRRLKKAGANPRAIFTVSKEDFDGED